MLPRPRSPIQRSKTLNPNDQKAFSAYQDAYSTGLLHGNLVNHLGNDAYIPTNPYVAVKPIKHAFLSASYRNLTANRYISNRVSDSYNENYRTTEDNNGLHRPIYTAPTRTKLKYLFESPTKSVAPLDEVALYKHNYLDGISNDQFVSKRWLKTETMSLRDIIACLMEMSDYMRNMSFSVNARKQFPNDANGTNQLDRFGQWCTKLNAVMESLLLAYNKLNSNALELKRAAENFALPENVIDRNKWDREMRPQTEREAYLSTEVSIQNDKIVFRQQKVLANRTLKETHSLLNSIENCVHKHLEDLFEEGKILMMSKLFNREYQENYVRDENGYIKPDHKKPIQADDWFTLANTNVTCVEALIKKAEKQTETVIATIERVGRVISEQWRLTHDIAKDQVEAGLKTQSKLSAEQYDIKQELAEMDQALEDTRRKMKHVKISNEFELSEMEGKLKQSKIDPYFDTKRENQIKYANRVWHHAYDLRNNLSHMNKHNKILMEKKRQFDVAIHSNHTGVNYDINTIIDPRRFQVGINPSIGMAERAYSVFN